MTSKHYSIMSFTDAMDKAFDIHKKNIGASALYLFLYYIISVIAYFVIFFIVMLSFAFTAVKLFDGFHSDDMFSHADSGTILAFSSVFIVVFGIMFLFKLLKEVGIIDIASKAFLNKPVRFEKALGLSLKKIPAVLTLVLAYGIVFSPLFFFFVLLVSNSDFMISFYRMDIGIILSAVVIVISFILLATLYMFSIHSLVLEKLYFFKALKRSRILVRNNYWRLLGINILFYLIVLAITYSIYSFFGVIAGLIIFILKALDVGESTLAVLFLIGNFLRLPLQIIFSLFISPLGGIFTTILYYNQRFKNEGYDIELELKNLKDKIVKEKKSEISSISIDSNERKI